MPPNLARDPLLKAYAQALRKAGGRAHLLEEAGLVHGYGGFAGVVMPARGRPDRRGDPGRTGQERDLMQQRRDPVLIAWVLGLGLAALVYVVGPSHFLFRLLDTFHVLMWRLGEFIADLSSVALDAVRALAIGLYATFVVLALTVLRRGGRARGALVVVTVLFLILVAHDDAVTESNGRWTAALALSAVGAVVMTARLRQTSLVPRPY
jgi:hypothetical protein